MKYMTSREEDILTNQNYIENGTVIDKLMQSLIVTSIDYNDLLVGDKNAILVAARILGYGSEYTFKYPHPKTGVEEEVSIELSSVEDKIINEDLITEGINEFEFILPHSKIVLELSENLTLNEFRISCIRLAKALGYTDDSIQKLFGKLDSIVKRDNKQTELLFG